MTQGYYPTLTYSTLYKQRTYIN